MKNLLYKRENIVFGASGYFEKVYYEILKMHNIKILYICDNDVKKQGGFLKGTEIISFEKLLKLFEKQQYNIIIASSYKEEIYKQLKEKGLEEFAYLDLAWDYTYINEGKELEFKYEELMKNVDEIKTILGDEISRDIYKDSFKYLFSMDRNLIIDRDNYEKQYFLDEFIECLNNSCVIDCGAYTGDTIASLIDLHVAPKKIIAYEAAKQNYIELKKNIAKIPGIKFEIYNKGVWSEVGNLHLTSEQGSGAKIDEKASICIECTTIDDSINEKIDFVKMDIEGAELQALKGGMKTIKRDRPILAICIYHSIKEMIEIPQYLIRNLEEYVFKIRRYSKRGAEVVLYCIPKEKMKIKNYI